MGNRKRSDEAYAFPSVDLADDQGFLAYGGDLSPERLISAYESGIFPWYEEGQPILWWAPPERMILRPGEMKVSKSLKQTLRSGKYQVKIDRAFEEVIDHCARVKRRGQDGTWITPEMKQAYLRLHKLGFAHSFETYKDGILAGGLYGISLGKAFFGESMFSLESDASKVAFHSLSEFTKKNGFDLIDCQLYTEHLASLGAHTIARDDFNDLLKKALAHPDHQGKWSWHE